MQQWWCKKCRQSFTFRKSVQRQHFTDVFIKEAVKDFIQGRSSYAVIKERKRVSIGTLSAWVNEFGKRCMNPVEISDALRLRTSNKWSGILLLDGKYLNRRMVLLLAIDYGTLDIVAWLVCEVESEVNYTQLIDLVEGAGYVIYAVVSDGEPSIIGLTQPQKLPYFIKGSRPRLGIIAPSTKPPRLPGIFHQWCVVHAERELNRFTIKLPQVERKILDEIIHKILFFRTVRQAEKWRNQLLANTFNQTRIHEQISRMIVTRWKLLMTHHVARVKGRKIPRSTNSIENVISYVNTRLKTMRRIRTKRSAEAICSLIVVNYRSKPLINTKNKLKRGKSPLELAIGNKQKFDWMDFVKKSCS